MKKDIKILVACHKPYWTPKDPVYCPIHVGAAGKESIGFPGDDTGDNISEKNPYYCELTGLYWAWKNLDADYIGLCHYRRYFTQKEEHTIEGKRREILGAADWEALLSVHPVIVPGRRKYYIETNRSHYNHAHPAVGLDETEAVIHEKYPECDTAFRAVMQKTSAHMFNMFVMRRDYYVAYMAWLFDVLFELEHRVDITGWDTFQQRIYGFVSELLLDVWLETNKIPYAEQNVSFIEKQNWVKKGGLFLKRKFL
jgi:hypothetical protein